MENKLYLVCNGKVSEVEVVKDSPKQLTIGKNIAYLRLVKKSNLDYFNTTNECVFSYDKELAIQVYNKHMEVVANGLLARGNATMALLIK